MEARLPFRADNGIIYSRSFWSVSSGVANTAVAVGMAVGDHEKVELEPYESFRPIYIHRVVSWANKHSYFVTTALLSIGCVHVECCTKSSIRSLSLELSQVSRTVLEIHIMINPE